MISAKGLIFRVRNLKQQKKEIPREYIESLIGWSKDLKSKYYRELLDNYINTKPEYQKYKGILQEYGKETMTKKEKEDLF